MASSFVLHIGCPAAASSDKFTLVDEPVTTTLAFNQATTRITTVKYTSLTSTLPFTCQIQPTYQSITTKSYVDYSVYGGKAAPTLQQTSTNFTCLTSDCGTLDISNTVNSMFLSYKITFNVGGKTGNRVSSVTSNLHNVEVYPQMIRLKSSVSLTVRNICDSTDVDISGVARLIASDSSIITKAPGVGSINHEIHNKNESTSEHCGASDFYTSSSKSICYRSGLVFEVVENKTLRIIVDTEDNKT